MNETIYGIGWATLFLASFFLSFAILKLADFGAKKAVASIREARLRKAAARAIARSRERMEASASASKLADEKVRLVKQVLELQYALMQSKINTASYAQAVGEQARRIRELEEEGGDGAMRVIDGLLADAAALRKKLAGTEQALVSMTKAWREAVNKNR